MKIFYSLFLTFILAFLYSCQKIEPQMDSITGFNSGSPPANEVWIQGMAFIPSTIVIKAGTTLKFVNKDLRDHTVTADNNSYDSGTLAPGKSYTKSFSSGVSSYHCALHPEMIGSVIAN